MLVLQRKEGESIVIGDDVVIRFHRISGNRVKVAIEAPAELNIRRGELCDWSIEATATSNKDQCDDNIEYNSVASQLCDESEVRDDLRAAVHA